MNLSSLIQAHRAEILWRFVEEVERGALAPAGTTRPALIDHLPILLDEIVVMLDRHDAVRPGQDATDENATARLHGEQRWELGYDLEAVVREYGVLRHVIFKLARQHEAEVSLDSVDVLSKCLNVGIAEAVTAYVHHRDEQAQALAQREIEVTAAANRAKDEFIATVSHELRTPLNAILGWVRLVKTGNYSGDKLQHALDVIQRNADAQNALLGDLLDISRAATHQLRMSSGPVQLGAVVDSALEDASQAFAAKSIQVKSTVVHAGSSVDGDSERLRQIVWNLLSNAAKFTPKGGQVDVSLRRMGADVELVVSDSGIGIDPAFLPAVFESFRQGDTSTSRSEGGLGLGLAITRQLVALHGGSIVARSDGIGRGATFVVRLPASAHEPSVVPGADPGEAASQLSGVSVLLVEDDEDSRGFLLRLLEMQGMRVSTAASAAEALALMARRVPDILISDVGMPGTDGYQLLRAVRRLDGEAASVPAIALTAFARNEDRADALAAGFQAHLKKPADPAELTRTMAKLIRRGK